MLEDVIWVKIQKNMIFMIQYFILYISYLIHEYEVFRTIFARVFFYKDVRHVYTSYFILMLEDVKWVKIQKNAIFLT